MKLSMQHAQEFSRILEKPNLKPQEIDNDGNFKFQFKGMESESTLTLDPGMVAGLIQLKKSVERGQSPEDQLKSQISAICKELKI